MGRPGLIGQLGIIVVGTMTSYALAFLLEVPFLVPVLNTLPAIPVLIRSLKEGKVGRGVTLMLVWALTLGVCATTLSYLQPHRAESLFIHAAAYRREMLEWILTGRGAESTPSVFVPQHLLHASVFCALALASGSVLAMAMGALLMNYMGYYVGSVATLTTHPWQTIALGWHPWAIVRIASFVTLGVVLAGPLLSHLVGFRYKLTEHLHLLVVAVIGLIVDIVLKWLLAPGWAGLLRQTL